jgi:short-subunit dehydrogenase
MAEGTRDRGVAVVTGGSSGIGEATARELTRRGWRCVLVARREDRLRAIAAELGDGADFQVCDVAEREDVERAAAAILQRHPRIGLLVNNAGIPARGRFTDADPELIERVTKVNYLGGVWCLRAFLPGLQAAGEAHVVNNVSVAGTVSFAPAGPYSAAKHAQLAFSRSTAALLKGSGIRVHTILAGFVETDSFPQKTALKSAIMRRFVIDAPTVARTIADAVDKNKREVTVPWFPYRLASIAQALVPGIVSRFVGMTRHRGET